MDVTVKTPDDKMLAALRNSVAPGLTEPEFKLFAEMVKATGLNPVTKEIWAIKAGGRLQLMTGINGFLRIANQHPAFDGMEVIFEWDQKGDRKTLLSATAKVYRKDRRFPSVATAYWEEYSKPSPVWKAMPSIMLAKCAKSLALREAFVQELGGLYTQEEMPADFAPPKHEPVVLSTDGEERVKITETTISVSQPEEVVFIDTTTGEIDELPDWDKKAEKAPKKALKKAVPTYYNLESLEGDKLKAAEAYLVSNCAVRLTETHWRAPIKLDRLTQCIDAEFSE
jgi:phage recombination protein Bet